MRVRLLALPATLTGKGRVMVRKVHYLFGHGMSDADYQHTVTRLLAEFHEQARQGCYKPCTIDKASFILLVNSQFKQQGYAIV